MRLNFLELDGFRGYSNPLRIEFANQFTIIDGRNGVGKSTIFDAIEYALTGSIRKHEVQKAAGETIADYVWWRGSGATPAQRYVRVGFESEGNEFEITRREFDPPDKEELSRLEARLCDKNIAPDAALVQLCTNAIIRDEQITKLSLDMKETDRYALLRDALGAIDSERWIERGSRLASTTKRRISAAEKEAADASSDLALAARRLDEIRGSIVADKSLADAVSRLQAFAQTNLAADELSSHARERIASLNSRIDSLQSLAQAWDEVEVERSRIGELSSNLELAQSDFDSAKKALSELQTANEDASSKAFSDQARDLVKLADLGRKLGLQENQCPLCASEQTEDKFARGLERAETLAHNISVAAARAAEAEQQREKAEERLSTASSILESIRNEHSESTELVKNFDGMRQSLGLSLKGTRDSIDLETANIRKEVEQANSDMRILDTIRLNNDLDRAQQAQIDAQKRLERAQEKAGRARKSNNRAQALHDAARRAASETLDLRLERVLPLMSELYRRLRPHPTWKDIEYSIRGDVRRFLRLQVGEDLNPQFLFSSGQRRATGLAFLLSVNLSLAWSNWRTIMLDDPVQHVDDFRAVNLAELLSKLVLERRQIVCAVEDAALADLLCRRLPIESIGSAKRLTLGPNEEGSLSLADEKILTPHIKNSVVSSKTGQIHLS